MALTSNFRFVLALSGALCCALLAGGPGAGTSQAASQPRPSFSTEPALSPAFGWNRSDYVIRCDGDPVTVTVSAPEGWRSKIAGGSWRNGDFEVNRPLGPGRAFPVAFSRPGTAVRNFHVRCLPLDFPEYLASGNWSGAPRLTLVQMSGQYGAAFDSHGTPVWWDRFEGSPNDLNFLRDGTVSYAPVDGIDFRRYVIRSLTGRKIRTVAAGNGLGTDVHDLQLLANGNYLLGAHRRVGAIDTTRFGGQANSTIDTAQVQEITRSGKVVWSWNAYPRIGLAETGRWWETISGWGQPFDVNHWNSIDRKGRLILLSFRHLDAIFCVDRRTGKILWKLGGTRSPKRLRVLGDPRGGYPLGGQHDARFGPDGLITVFDNASFLTRKQPRAVAYRINWKNRTARLVNQVTDPLVKVSIGIGSARLTNQGKWLIGWGAIGPNGLLGGYDRNGSPNFRIQTPSAATYRANPVYGAKPTIQQLRTAMNRMAATGG